MGELGEDWKGVVERGGAARFETGEGRGRGPMVKRGGAASFETGGGRGFAVGGGPGGGAVTLALADATALR